MENNKCWRDCGHVTPDTGWWGGVGSPRLLRVTLREALTDARVQDWQTDPRDREQARVAEGSDCWRHSASSWGGEPVLELERWGHKATRTQGVPPRLTLKLHEFHFRLRQCFEQSDAHHSRVRPPTCTCPHCPHAGSLLSPQTPFHSATRCPQPGSSPGPRELPTPSWNRGRPQSTAVLGDPRHALCCSCHGELTPPPASAWCCVC